MGGVLKRWATHNGNRLRAFVIMNVTKKSYFLVRLALDYVASRRKFFGGRWGGSSENERVLMGEVAEAVRFELTKGSHPRQFSRLVPSTARPRFLSGTHYAINFSPVAVVAVLAYRSLTFARLHVVRYADCRNARRVVLARADFHRPTAT